jgi:NitT/TauT family transport system substrate-binding protein
MKPNKILFVIFALMLVLQACAPAPESTPVAATEAAAVEAPAQPAPTEQPPPVEAPVVTEAPAPAETEAPAAEPLETIKLKVQLVPYFSYAPLYIAQEEGYFAEQGLEVEFIKMQGSAVFVSLLQGDLDIAATFLSGTTLSAVGRGETVRIVADKGYVDPSSCTVNALLARKDLVDSGALADPSKLKGLKIKYDMDSIQAFAMDKLLQSGGLSTEDVEQVDFDSSAVVVEAFANGMVDLAVESEPWITRNVNTGNAVVWKDFKDLIPDSQFSHIIYGVNLLEKNPEGGKRFMVAYLKGVRQYNEGKTERNKELMIAFTGLEPELVEQLCWPTFRNDLLINTQSVLDFQDWAIEKGLLDTKVTVEQFWDPSFAEYALSVVGE